MDQEGEILTDVYTEQYSQVRSFVQNLTYYQVLSSCAKPFEGEFFEAACDAFLGAATLAWCNVFVSYKSHVYWSKLVEKMSKEVKQNFRSRVYQSTHLRKKQYEEYLCSIKKLRDKYVAHIDLDWQESVPHDLSFDNAIQIALQYECWLRELLRKEGSFTPGDVSLNDIIESAKGDVVHLTAILSYPKK